MVTNEASIEQSEQFRRDGVRFIEKSQQKLAEGDYAGERAGMQNAMKCIEQSLALHSSNHQARILLVSCAISVEDYERARHEALVVYEELDLEQLNSMQDSVLHLSIAHAAKMLGNMEEAVQFLTEANELYPKDPHPCSLLGQILEGIGSYEDAEQKCREALQRGKDPQCQRPLVGPNLYYSLCCLGSSLLHLGNPQEAEGFLKEAQREDASLSAAWRLLAQVYDALGDEVQAHKMREQASKLEADERSSMHSRRKDSRFGSKHGSRAASMSGSLASHGSRHSRTGGYASGKHETKSVDKINARGGSASKQSECNSHCSRHSGHSLRKPDSSRVQSSKNDLVATTVSMTDSSSLLRIKFQEL